MDISSRILSDVTVFGKYARYLPDKKRRETWDEIVTRNMDMHIRKFPFLEEKIREAYRYVFDKKILPSMRSLQFGGAAIEKNNARIYNCCFLPVDDIHAFSEAMFLLLAGTGVGYSVRRADVDKLPELQLPAPAQTYTIDDSIEGWADAVKVLLSAFLYGTFLPRFDYSKIRPKGSPLSSGGKAPGHKPLEIALQNINDVLASKVTGSKLKPIECHDMMCFLSDAVRSGGIRRAALISLFDKDDYLMVQSKTNFVVDDLEYIQTHYFDSQKPEEPTYECRVQYRDTVQYTPKELTVYLDKHDYALYREQGVLPWHHFHPQRGRSNNSVVYLRGQVTQEEFAQLWQQVEDSHAGEPGIYWTNDETWGCNPCVEIALRAFQFCNLCEINAATIKDQADYNRRAWAAAFIGTLQASYTNFTYLREIWRQVTESEALIGIGMTGIAAGIVMSLNMAEAAAVVVETNKLVAELIGINPAARTTCVKPSGTSTLVLGCLGSGVHDVHARHYIRRLRLGKEEPLYLFFLKHAPSLVEDDLYNPENMAVLSFPQKAQSYAIIRDDTRALDLLERVKRINQEWIAPGHVSGTNRHNVSCTVSIKPNEWREVGEWMWENQDYYTGLSCLPFDGGTYKQAPFETCSEEMYNEMMAKIADVDLANVVEETDATDLENELACAGGSCEIKKV